MIDVRTARDRALPTVQRLASVSGRATSGLRMTPGFLICGAQRCGTTSMYQALRTHPDTRRPVSRKGVHYFDDAGYLRGMSWYRGHFPLRRPGQAAGRAVAFESSPYYLFHPAAADRIARDLPDAKILILVRDPVERAYSAWTHETARGYETETFERALELEDERIAGAEDRLLADPGYVDHAHRHQAYVHRGLFIDQILRMIDAVGRDRVHVVDSEDFWLDPVPVWNEVLEFLQLAPDPGPQFRKHNARPRSSMPEPLRAELNARFDDSDARLQDWWGRTPSWRR